MESENSKLILGTAQFGMAYGIANKTGQPDLAATSSMIHQAVSGGIVCIDTAQVYGQSEAIIGRCLEALNIQEKVRITSKLDPMAEYWTIEEITQSVEASLRKLNVKKLHGLLVHRGLSPKSWQSKFGPAIRQLKEKGKLACGGVSIYSEEELNIALGIADLEIVQLPFNIIDQRALQNNWFQKARDLGKQVQVRSIYLQGFLLLNETNLPSALHAGNSILLHYRDLCQAHQLSPQQLAFYFVCQHLGEASMILGVETCEQLSENLQQWQLFHKKQILIDGSSFLETIKRDDSFEKIANPTLWV